MREHFGRWLSCAGASKADSNPPRNGEVARSDGGVPTSHLHRLSRTWDPSAPLGHLPVPGRISDTAEIWSFEGSLARLKFSRRPVLDTGLGYSSGQKFSAARPKSQAPLQVRDDDFCGG
jgi:hypothetical protein